MSVDYWNDYQEPFALWTSHYAYYDARGRLVTARYGKAVT